MPKWFRSFLQAPLLLLAIIAAVVFWGAVLFAIAVFKWPLAKTRWRNAITNRLHWCTYRFSETSMALFRFAGLTRFEVRGGDDLRPDGCYLILANHQSWADIPVVFCALEGKSSFPKFFVKQELIWVPIIGWGCWVMEMPFMKRYSKAHLEKHPEDRGKDLETTRLACRQLRGAPSSLLIFAEGTRNTPKKYLEQQPHYQHLLNPKAGGAAFTLGSMGNHFNAIVDFTIIYPEGKTSVWDALLGDMDKIVVDIRTLPVPDDIGGKDYRNDPAFKAEFQQWIGQLWAEKDARIDAFRQQQRS